jgi:hypothetical protein
MHTNRIKRALLVKQIVDENFEPGSHRGSMLDVYRRKVSKQFPISEPTFYRYMEIAVGIDGYVGNGSNRILKHKPAPTIGKEDPRQLRLFDF